MNPLSSFSFGKIIKTFLPGLMVTGVPLILLEFFYQRSQLQGDVLTDSLWKLSLSHSFLWQVVIKDGVRASAFGAALIPVALTLGFFLNTALWLWINPCFRKWADRGLGSYVLQARAQLEGRAASAFSSSGKPLEIPRIPLQAFYIALHK